VTNGNGLTVEYRCPDDSHPISRSVHLGRLARFYPACRQCEHRDDTGSLSARQVRQLVEVRPRALRQPLFHEEGAGGLYEGELTPAAARQIAAAFGLCFAKRQGRPKTAVLGSDGRAITAELVAAVSEGLRWTGCDVVDVGPATSACLAVAIDQLDAAGGVHVGQAMRREGGSVGQAFQPDLIGLAQSTRVRLKSLTYVGLKFWAPGPLSRGGLLDDIERVYPTGIDRPTRSYGAARRFQADETYLAELTPYYHALRPLRVVLDCASAPLVRYLARLIQPVACRVVPCQPPAEQLAEQVIAGQGHFGIRIEDDGEVCSVLDEQGRPVPSERLALLLVRFLRGPDFSCGAGVSPAASAAETAAPQHVLLGPVSDTAGQTGSPCRGVVLEDGASAALSRRLESLGICAVASDPRREAMAAAVRQHGALLGGGPRGRFWYPAHGQPLPDALRTLTFLLAILSRDDRPFSAVLDEEAPFD